MERNELISVIIPVYKVREKFLRCCVESVLEQSYRNIEVMLVDDGSPDNCGKICDEYAKKDCRVKVIHTENYGVSSARNTALNECNGNYVTFVDSDDYIGKDYLFHLYDAMQKTGSECVICGCFTVDEYKIYNSEDIKKKVVDREQAVNDLLYMKRPFHVIEVTAVWASLYTMKSLDSIRFNQEMSIGEDFEFKYKVFKDISNITYISVQDYYYMVHENSAMRKGFDRKNIAVIGCLEHLIFNSKSTIYYQGVISRSVNIAIVILLMIRNKDKQYKNEQEQIIEFIKKYRKCVLLNKNSRIKVRMALILSFFGFSFMKNIYTIFNS